MALPRIDAPVYELTLPLSKKQIRFRPFLVKEQKNLLMAMEAGEKASIEQNVVQVLNNCTLTEGVDIDKLPVVDIEYYFLQLRARSVGEIVENRYTCNNLVDAQTCGFTMESNLNLLEIKVENIQENNDIIQLTDTIQIKLKYPEFSLVSKLSELSSATDIAFEMIADSVDYLYDGEQFFYGKETPREEMIEFLEQLDQKQFSKIESFFENLPRLEKKVKMTCGRCGFNHVLNVEGLESFFV